MENDIFFNQFVTKNLHPIGGDQRFFEGYLTVQVKDKQGEITIVDELIKVLPIWMDRGAPISDTHSNRIIGKGISYAKVDYKTKDGGTLPAIKITGKIHKDYHLDNEIWDKIKSGEYKGLSFGGATKANRTPKILKDGSVAYELKSLEHYEVAVCKDPAVPLALITDYNPLAKAITDNVERREDGKMVIKCDKFGCTVDKMTDFANADGDRPGAYNQNVEPNKSSNRETSPVNDDDDANIGEEKEEEEEEVKKAKGDYCPNCGKHKKLGVADNGRDMGDMTSLGGACPNCGDGFKPKEEVKKDGDTGYGSVRHSGMEYNTNQETQQITKVPEEGGESSDAVATRGKEEEEEEEDDNKKKSGYQTEAGNNQLGGQGSTKDDTYKNSENYINSGKERSDKDMVENTSNNESNSEQSEEEEKKDDEVEKSDFQEAIKSNISTLTDVIKSLAETQKDVSSTLVGIDDRLKALETPTDLPLKPQTSASEDVGAKVTVPDTYQSNSIQVGLHDDKEAEKKPESDPSGLKMQEKSFDFTTETPRPSAALDTINKSAESDMSFVLKDAREGGNLSVVARNILAGKYYTPTPDEVGTY
jgi:hypothetical protein